MPRTFGEVLDSAHEYRICYGTPEISGDEAMELALEAQREARTDMRAEDILRKEVSAWASR
ncbi:hypothetical protein FDG2_1874 [Candidatus Protofrankia californiensis]|uniref:Uncharacterized protein n=1 Tax=Candidatus Protofrankia californiensis TaxID=1839754 RepID=A0A1C3NWK2_9ACTN|nr:hypothetical protein FDG2_1874 [Candidatus Protofrankia californiensis]